MLIYGSLVAVGKGSDKDVKVLLEKPEINGFVHFVHWGQGCDDERGLN